MRSFVQAPLILFLAASAATAASNIKVTSQGAESVTDARDMTVTVTVTNHGEEPVNLLHGPNTPLSTAPTDKFIVASEQNGQPKFQGIMVKYVPEYAAKSGYYTTLKPGESVITKHQLSDMYNFNSEAGTYTVKPKGDLHMVDSSGKIQAFSADTEGHVTKIAANSAKYSARSLAKLSLVKKSSQDGISFVNCTEAQQPIIAAAVPNAVNYIYGAADYLKGISGATDRYTTWFGAYTDDRKNLVQSHYVNIGDSPKNVKYDCSSCAKTIDHSEDTYAYVQPDDPSTIYLCGAFWTASPTGSDSQAGTIVHESTHFTKYAGTQDIQYGEDGCKQLAQTNPDEAINNADSNEYFAENTPALN